jgi:hypothetical protein
MRVYLVRLWSLLALFFLVGCAPTRLIQAPTAPETIADRYSRNDEMEVRLVNVILPGGAGSWHSESRWHEYVIQLTNFMPYLAVQQIKLIDGRGVYVSAGGTNVGLTTDDVGKDMSRTTAITQGLGVGGVIASAASGIPFLGLGASLLTPYVDWNT